MLENWKNAPNYFWIFVFFENIGELGYTEW